MTGNLRFHRFADRRVHDREISAHVTASREGETRVLVWSSSGPYRAITDAQSRQRPYRIGTSTKKSVDPETAARWFHWPQGPSPSVLCVILHHEVGFHHHRVRHVRKSGNTGEFRFHAGVINIQVVGEIAFRRTDRLEHERKLPGLFANLDDIADTNPVGRNVDAFSVDQNVAVIDELPGRKNCRNELCTVHDGVKSPFQQADQVFARVAPHAFGFRINPPKLAFGQIAIVAFQLLLGRSWMPKSDNLLLRRMPCWPGPDSLRLTGDFGRPHMFSPMRRSILYLAAVRLVTAGSFQKCERCFPFLILELNQATGVPLTGATNTKMIPSSGKAAYSFDLSTVNIRVIPPHTV